MADSSTLVDRVKIFVESSGTGPFQLGNALPSFRGSEALVDGLTYSYAVESGSDYEVGRGVYVLAVDQLLRAPTLSSNGGAPVAFPANVAVNFTALAADLVSGLEGTGTVRSVQASGGTTGMSFTGGPITGEGTLILGGTLGVTNGGTGTIDGISDGTRDLFDSLADADGASKIGFEQDGSDVVTRTIEEKARERQSVADRSVMGTAFSTGRSVLFNSGSYLFQAGEEIAEDTVVYGDGGSTEVTVLATPSLPNLYGFTLASRSGITDVRFILDPNGENWAAAIGFPNVGSNMRVENLIFTAAGAATGTYAEYIDGADVSDVFHRNLTYNTIALPQIKGNLDASVQTRFSYVGYRSFNGIDGFNINTPAGEWSHGWLEDAWVRGATQFGYAFAGPGCFGWYGTIRGSDNNYELAHIEDATSRFKFHVIGERNNLLPGTAGSPSAANGAVSLIGGSNEGLLSLSLDLTQNTGGSPVAVCIQAGGPRVSDGLTVNPFNIQIGGNVKGGAGTTALIAIEATDRIVLDHLSVESAPGDVMDPCLSIPGSNVGGELYVKTPGVLFEGNDNTPMTGLDSLVLSDVTADFTAWTNGITTDRTAIQIAQLLKINRAFTADVTATWNPIMPVFRDCWVKAWWKFQQNGPANGAAVFCDEFVIESGVIVPRPVIVRAGGSSDPIPGHNPAVAVTGNTVSGEYVISNLSALAGIGPGDSVSGTGIPTGAKVLAVLSANSVSIDKPLTASGTGVSLNFRVQPKTDLAWRVNISTGMLEAHIYNGTTAVGNFSLVMLGNMTA